MPSGNTSNPLEHLLGQASRAGRLYGLLQHMTYLQSLTALAAPLLPEGADWQVAAYDGSLLCLATENHCMASQLRYLQHHYVGQLRQLPELATIKQIRVITQVLPKPRTASHHPLPQMTPATRDVIQQATGWIQDQQLTQALKGLATPNATSYSSKSK